MKYKSLSHEMSERLSLGDDTAKARFMNEVKSLRFRQRNKGVDICEHGDSAIEWSEDLQVYFCVRCGYPGAIDL